MREKTDKETSASSNKSPVEVGNHEFIAALFGVIVVFSLGIGM